MNSIIEEQYGVFSIDGRFSLQEKFNSKQEAIEWLKSHGLGEYVILPVYYCHT